MFRIAPLGFLLWLIHLAQSQILPRCNNQQTEILDLVANKFTEIQIVHGYNYEFYGRGHYPHFGTRHGEDIYHRLHYHLVIFEDNPERHNKILYVNALIRPIDLVGDMGTVVHPDALRELKPCYKICGADQAGHIVPRAYGGHGYAANMFAQNGNLNMGRWDSVTDEIGDFLRASRDNRNVTMEVAFSYEGPRSCRPSIIYYRFTFVAPGRRPKSVSGYFENEDHTHAIMGKCSVTAVMKVYYVTPSHRRYFDKRNCQTNPFASRRYGL